MADWKDRFRQTAAAYLQRKHDEEHGYISIPMDPPEPMGLASVILMLPIGVFLFFNAIAFLTSGFKHFIRFFPDNLVMILIILAAVVVVILLKMRDARKLREYNEEKNRLATLRQELDDLSKDHPEVPRWWRETPETWSDRYNRYKSIRGGVIRHTTMNGGAFFLNQDQQEADVTGAQVQVLLSKTDRFMVLSNGDGPAIREDGVYMIRQAQVTYTANFGAAGSKQRLGADEFRFMPTSMYDRMCQEQVRQSRELIRYIDDISPKEPGQTGLSEAALAEKRERDYVDGIVKIQLQDYFGSPSEDETERDSKYDMFMSISILGYSIYDKANSGHPIAFALFRDPKDVRVLRLYMHRTIKLIDPDDPNRAEKLFDLEPSEKAHYYVVGSCEMAVTQEGWKKDLRTFLQDGCGWIDTDFTEQPRWGLDKGDWAAFMQAHVNT